MSIFIAFAYLGHADVAFYVDPAWTGAQNGTGTQPWTKLSASSWATVNSALNTGNVTIYFAARPAEIDTNQIYDSAGDGTQLEIDLTAKTTNTTHFLTLDGNRLYNTNRGTPIWAVYTGSSMCVVRNFNSQNATHTKYSNIIIHGFNIICNAPTKLVTICGDNWILENCNASHTATVTNGPGILLVPTADGTHAGSSYYGPPCTNVIIRRNVVHDTFGEAIYLGGGGMPLGETGSGYPSHSGVAVSDNEIYSAGRWGAQGDGIDIKAGIENCVISGNNIHSLSCSNGIRAIVAQGQTNGATGTNLLIERNFIHDCNAISDYAIAINDSWGEPQGVVIRNNIICNIKGPGAAAGVGICSTQDQALILNNTIYRCQSEGINCTYSNQTVKLRNNLVFANNDDGLQTFLAKGKFDSDYNAHDNGWSYSGEGAHSLALSQTGVLVSVANAVLEDFHLPAGSVLIKAGELQAFTTDFYGRHRATNGPWDIGACEGPGPFPPTNLRLR
jgi:parallel beta helix pectate lyase-like protein